MFPQSGQRFIVSVAKQALNTVPWDYILFYLYYPYVVNCLLTQAHPNLPYREKAYLQSVINENGTEMVALSAVLSMYKSKNR